MDVTQASIDEYNRALAIVAKTNVMLNKIKEKMNNGNEEESNKPDQNDVYDSIIEALLLNPHIKYRD